METKNEYISYGFRVKERIPLTNGEIRKIIFHAGEVFRLLTENKIDELELYFKYNPGLDAVLEKWVSWSEQK